MLNWCPACESWYDPEDEADACPFWEEESCPEGRWEPVPLPEEPEYDPIDLIFIEGVGTLPFRLS